MANEWVTVVIVSHDKFDYCKEAIKSVIDQSFQNWKCVVYDSGVLYDKGYFDDITDPRVKVVRSNETEEMRKKYNMASRLFNSHNFTSEWAMFLCDDDLLYKEAMMEFYAYAISNPEACAMYGHAKFSGINQPFQFSRASSLKGKCVNGTKLDCRVDGGQVCVRSDLLKQHKWQEDKDSQGHADGFWLESIGSEVPFEPVDVMVLHNRKIPGISLGAK